jgi:hypothetical protein
MNLAVAFWILMLLWLFFCWFHNSSPGTFGSYGWAGHSILLFILLGILGWHAFGAPVHG